MPIQIRKYPNFLEVESPGAFLDGIDETNYLRKTASRNPNIMDVLRTIRYAEKAGSGFDKIFTSLLSRGKRLPEVEVTDSSVTFRLFADIYSNKLIELSLQHRQAYGEDMDVDTLLILNEIINHKRISFAELANSPFVSESKLHKILEDLQEKEFIETTGKTSGLKYILHKTKNISTEDKINYTRLKKQNKARQKEAILRYLDDIDTITNSEARQLLKLTSVNTVYVSKIFKELLDSGYIEIASSHGHNRYSYRKRTRH